MIENKSVKLTIGISSIVLACTIILFLLGYSAALAIESVFGIPAKLAYSSTLELLHLSSYVFSGWTEALSNHKFIENFKKLTITTLTTGITITISFLILKKLIKNKFGEKLKSNFYENKTKGNFLFSIIKWTYKERLFFLPTIIGGLIPSLAVLIIFSFIALFAFIPILGFDAAKQHLQSWYIEADYCSPLVSREDRIIIKNNQKTKTTKNENQKKSTPCLAIWKNGILIANGRFIASSNNHIITFNPKNGDVHMEPIDGASVRVSDDEAIDRKTNQENIEIQ